MKPVLVPQQPNLNDFFQTVITSNHDFDEKLETGVLLYGIDKA